MFKAKVKRQMQLWEDSPAIRESGEIVLAGEAQVGQELEVVGSVERYGATYRVVMHEGRRVLALAAHLSRAKKV